MTRLHVTLAGLALVLLAGGIRAGVEADPTKEYTLTPEAGPWLIYAACYVGPEAPQLAHEMVLEIRSRYNLPAWVLNRGAEERARERERIDQIHRQYPNYDGPIRGTRIQEQCAVLIGGYKDVDTANRALKDVKRMGEPSSPRLMPTLVLAPTNPDKLEDGKKPEAKVIPVNPFKSSFVTRNTTIPQTPQPKKEDIGLIRKLNEYESLSVLKCKQPYTLVVAAYQGLSMIQVKTESSSFLERLWGKSSGETLEASGQNAHNFAEVLRGRGFDAYVLHLRGGSLVTIGGFDRPDDPKMAEAQRAFADRLRIAQGPQLVPQPFAIEVPH